MACVPKSVVRYADTTSIKSLGREVVVIETKNPKPFLIEVCFLAYSLLLDSLIDVLQYEVKLTPQSWFREKCKDFAGGHACRVTKIA